jgi:putative spermidine/putrescine transport system ATP-binding protein
VTRLAQLELRDIRKTFGQTVALANLSLDVAAGELFCLLGPSGCGKTTLLGVVGGLVSPDRGSVRLGSADITALPMQRRNIGIVFQSYALFPHLTVEENIAFGLHVRRMNRTDTAQRVLGLLQLTRLQGKGERYPKQLSGGEQQRVAVARALAIEPSLLLLDEPFSNLDAKLRDELRWELRRVQREAEVTTILVTHDQDEAFALGDRIGLMRAGTVEQLGSPEELYARPTSEFTARFIGESNVLTGALTPGTEPPALNWRGHLIPLPGHPSNAIQASLMIRPERMRLQVDPPDCDPSLPGTIQEVTYRGLGWMYLVRCAGSPILVFEPAPRTHPYAAGDNVHVTWRVAESLLLPASESAA